MIVEALSPRFQDRAAKEGLTNAVAFGYVVKVKHGFYRYSQVEKGESAQSASPL